ncbi:hypothetical protein CPC08DRAFT_615342, partial [Agrocybe pediades]
NANRGWLTEGEATAIIDYANQLADEGWGLSHRRIEEHANEIICAKVGSENFTGVGHNWTDRFVAKYKCRL